MRELRLKRTFKTGFTETLLEKKVHPISHLKLKKTGNNFASKRNINKKIKT